MLAVLSSSGVLARLPDNRTGKVEIARHLAGDPMFDLLCCYIDRAELELANDRLHSLTDGASAFVSDPVFNTRLAEADTASLLSMSAPDELAQLAPTTVSELISAFVASKSDQVSQSRLDQYEIPARAMEELMGGDTPLRELSPGDYQRVVNFLPAVPAWVACHCKGKSLQEAADFFEATHGEKAK